MPKDYIAPKPCTECGRYPHLIRDTSGWYVRCPHCGRTVGDELKEDATGCFECFDSSEQATAAWNAEAGQECNDESQELKPCPFCGGEAGVFTDDKDPDNIRYGIMCINPDCAFWGWFEQREEAINSWNRRAGFPNERYD